MNRDTPLPDILTFNDGRRVKLEDWPERRQAIKQLLLAFEYGEIPAIYQ